MSEIQPSGHRADPNVNKHRIDDVVDRMDRLDARLNSLQEGFGLLSEKVTEEIREGNKESSKTHKETLRWQAQMTQTLGEFKADVTDRLTSVEKSVLQDYHEVSSYVDDEVKPVVETVNELQSKMATYIGLITTTSMVVATLLSGVVNDWLFSSGDTESRVESTQIERVERTSRQTAPDGMRSVPDSVWQEWQEKIRSREGSP